MCGVLAQSFTIRKRSPTFDCLLIRHFGDVISHNAQLDKQTAIQALSDHVDSVRNAFRHLIICQTNM